MPIYCNYIPYTQSNVDEFVPDGGGVYKISQETKAFTVSVVYVGKGDDLRQQLTKHLSPMEDNVCLRGKIRAGNLWISWAEIASKVKRATEEMDLINRYKPTCMVHQQ